MFPGLNLGAVHISSQNCNKALGLTLICKMLQWCTCSTISKRPTWFAVGVQSIICLLMCPYGHGWNWRYCKGGSWSSLTVLELYVVVASVPLTSQTPFHARAADPSSYPNNCLWRTIEHQMNDNRSQWCVQGVKSLVIGDGACWYQGSCEPVPLSAAVGTYSSQWLCPILDNQRKVGSYFTSCLCLRRVGKKTNQLIQGIGFRGLKACHSHTKITQLPVIPLFTSASSS